MDWDDGDVVWMQQLRASFFVEYDFRSFPFDKQALVVEFEPRRSLPDQDIVLVGSRVLYAERPSRISEDINGWKVENPDRLSTQMFWRDLTRADESTTPDTKFGSERSE